MISSKSELPRNVLAMQCPECEGICIAAVNTNSASHSELFAWCPFCEKDASRYFLIDEDEVQCTLQSVN